MQDIDTVKPLLMVSNSEIEMFKKCRRKWNLSSFNRRNLVPKKPNLKFWIGTACHYALERYHGYGEDALVAFSRWAQEDKARLKQELGKRASFDFWSDLDEMIGLGETILSHYLVFTRKNPAYNFKYIATEYEFSVPIPNQFIYLSDEAGNWYDWVTAEWGADPFGNEQFQKLYTSRDLYGNDDGRWYVPPLYVGRLDGLVEDENGHVRIIDHKFMAQLVDPVILQLDTQTARYVWAANVAIQNGWWPEIPKGTVVRGALYNVVKKKAPKIPALTGGGSTSRSKSVDTTYEIFRATLLERGEDPRNFAEVLSYLRDEKGNRFFQLLPVHRSQRELDLVGDKLTYEYEDMARVASYTRDAGHPMLYPSPNRDCVWSCPYNTICNIANAGGDIEFYIDESMIQQKRTDLYASQLEFDQEHETV